MTWLCSKKLSDQSVDPLSDEGAGEAGRPGQTVRLTDAFMAARVRLSD